MMMEAREVDIFDYLQPVYQSKEELQQSSEIENFFLNSLWQNVADIYNNAFILTADEYGLARRERYLGISPPTSSTLEDRRFALLARYQEQAPYTMNSLIKMLDNLLGPENYEMIYDASANYIDFRIALSSNNMLNTIKDLIERVLPANMGYIVQLKYNTHGELEGFTHTQLQAYSHTQLREGTL